METKNSVLNSVLILIILLFSVNITNAQKYIVDNGTAFFKAKVSINSYTGTTDQLTGSIDFETGELEFTIPAKSINTLNKKRNEHMYELIKAEKYTTVSFKGNLIDLYDENINEKQTLKVKGKFTLAGVGNEITLSIDLTLEQNGLRLTADWSLLITDYKLEPPTKLFMTVNDKHELGINALLKKNK